jgi:2-methylisocitrate lyase-like PEP mutase family enzyme
MASRDERVETFHRLHAEGCFVLPNPWDVGSAVALEQMGFHALATTSAGYAWTLARPDNGVRRDEMLEHLREIAAAVAVPVNADFEAASRTTRTRSPPT